MVDRIKSSGQIQQDLALASLRASTTESKAVSVECSLLKGVEGYVLYQESC